MSFLLLPIQTKRTLPLREASAPQTYSRRQTTQQALHKELVSARQLVVRETPFPSPWARSTVLAVGRRGVPNKATWMYCSQQHIKFQIPIFRFRHKAVHDRLYSPGLKKIIL